MNHPRIGSSRFFFCVLLLLSAPGKDLNHGYLNYVEPDTTSSTSEIAEMLDETPGLERVNETPQSVIFNVDNQPVYR